METISAKLVNLKTQHIKTMNWGVINAVLLFVCYLSLLQQVKDEDLTYFTVVSLFCIFLPLFLLKFSLRYQRMANLCNVVSIFHIISCFLRAAFSMCSIYEVGDICGDCLCGTNKTCFISNNNTVFEIDQSDCQDVLLEAIFSVCLNLLMIGATLQIIKGLNSIVASGKLTTVTVNNMEVPDIEMDVPYTEEVDNRYVPPHLEEKSNIPSEIIQIDEEMTHEENEEGIAEGIAVGIKQYK